MKSKHLIILGCLAFAALSFYFLSVKEVKTVTASGWKNRFPPYVTDSIYADNTDFPDEAKIELGRYLFYDRRLSVNQSKSCASCHDPKFSFTDGYRRSIGALGDLHQRNAASLVNIVLKKYLTAADSTLHSPEQQMNNPLFHEQPVELGWKGHETEILDRVKKDNYYTKKFSAVFRDSNDPITPQHIRYSISAFIKTILSFNSPYDQYVHLNKNVLTDSEKRGMHLFSSLGCATCHGGFDFNTPTIKDTAGTVQFYFNTGLYNLNGDGSYPLYDQGLAALTGNKKDMGKYRVPSLRNLAFTAPYYHDGSASTLEEIIVNYENGGRTIVNGPVKGNGADNPYKSNLIKGFHLTSQQRKDIVRFLLSISDSSVLINKHFSNPFQHDETKL